MNALSINRLIFALLISNIAAVFADIKKMIICVPVADLRRSPEATPEGVHAPALSAEVGSLETQLGLGEFVLADEVQQVPGWLKVRALDQEKFSNDEWTGYPGYIQKSQAIAVEQWPHYNLVVTTAWAPIYAADDSEQLLAVTLGTHLEGTSDGKLWRVTLPDGSQGKIHENYVCEVTSGYNTLSELRFWVVQAVKDLLGSPYVWGGCTAYDPTNRSSVTSFDCSGLVWLAMRSCGLAVPRDAHDQYLKCAKIESGSDLQPGDLAFLVSPQSRSGRMSHVMFYIGDNKFIEATGLNHSSVTQDNSSQLTTRILEAEKFLKKSLAECKSGDLVSPTPDNADQVDNLIYFGTFLGSDVQAQQLRDAFLVQH